MAITPQCDRCKKELKEFGGLLFSPPDEKKEVKKFHLCKSCYEIIVQENDLPFSPTN